MNERREGDLLRFLEADEVLLQAVKSQLGVVIDEDFHWLWGGEERQRKMSNDDKGGIGGGLTS
jgi:hypothetical protein